MREVRHIETPEEIVNGLITVEKVRSIIDTFGKMSSKNNYAEVRVKPSQVRYDVIERILGQSHIEGLYGKRIDPLTKKEEEQDHLDFKNPYVEAAFVRLKKFEEEDPALLVLSY